MATIYGPYSADSLDIVSGTSAPHILGVYGWFTTSGDPANPCKVSIYDNTTNAGTKLITIIEEVSQLGTGNFDLMFREPVGLSTGLSVDITLAGAGTCEIWLLVE